MSSQQNYLKTNNRISKMKLHVIGTGSKGNAYLLKASDGQMLLIECGVRPALIKQAIGFEPGKVEACLISHGHLDHASGMTDVAKMGIKVYATNGTFKERGFFHHKATCIYAGLSFNVGYFRVIPFDVQHDALEPVGFLIHHPECGKLLFITDTFYVRHKFKALNNIIIEANYCEKIIEQKLGIESDRRFLRDRILQSHFSLQNCLELLKANDLSQVNNVVLIHLSDSNSDEKRFKREVEELTGKTVTVASNGLEIELNKQPF